MFSNCFAQVQETIKSTGEASKKNVLIASQKSAFKNEIIEEVQYNFDAINFKVSTVSYLKEVDIDNWDAVIILHSWEFLSPPRSVKNFIKKNLSKKDKVVVLTTSSGGTSKMDGIDAITGESVIEDTIEYANIITQRLKKILENKPN